MITNERKKSTIATARKKNSSDNKSYQARAATFFDGNQVCRS